MHNNQQIVDHYTKRLEALRSERSTWQPTWEEISRVLLPYSGRFSVTDRNKGERKDSHIYDSTATRALGIMSAGMMAGMTSPARPWFRLATPDPDMMEHTPVKMWLSDVTEIIRRVLSQSNAYRVLHQMYEEIGGFGTCSALSLDNFDTLTHFHPSTVGEYFLGTNHLGKVDTNYREFDMTVKDVVDKFGLDNVSKSTKDNYDKANYDSWVTVVHAIQPRLSRDVFSHHVRDLPFESVYFEKGGTSASGNKIGASKEHVLKIGGFHEYPGIGARWAVTGRDIYGRGPGHTSLGDINQLQHEQLSKGRGIEQQTNPSLQIPSSLKGQEEGLLPGGVVNYDPANPNGGVRRSYEVDYQLNYLLEDIRDVRERIMSNFYADLFQMIALSDRRQVTATEIAERHEEKLLMLGPVLERLHNEMLDPMIDRIFSQAMRANIIPEPPEEMQGQELKVQYVSMLAQAQQAVGTSAVDRLLGTVSVVSQFKPDVIDKIDTDEMIDAYADMLGVDPELIVPGEEVVMIRQQRQQQEAAASIAGAAPGLSQAAKNLSETDTESPSALTNLFSGL